MYNFSLVAKLANTWKKKRVDLNPIRPDGLARGTGACAPRWPNVAQGRGAHVRWHSYKRDPALLCNSTTSLHTILLVIIFANGPLNVADFTMGRSLDSPRSLPWWPTIEGRYAGLPRLAKIGVRGQPQSTAKQARLGSG